LNTAEILANSLHFDSTEAEDYNDAVNFVIHHFLPIFQYLFLAGLIGSIPVIIITAIKTAQSMLEEDAGGQTGSNS